MLFFCHHFVTKVMEVRDDTVHTALQALGLTGPEVRLYLALLELGSQPASVLARKAGLKRGHTYNVLTRLMEQGIVQEFVKSGVKQFTASMPAVLLSLLERRKEGIEAQERALVAILPSLECLRNPFILQPKVRLFQGIEGIKEIYEETLRDAGGALYAIGDFAHYFPEERNKELNDWMWKYCDRRAKRGIWYIGIVNKSPVSDLAYRKRKEQKRKLKMLQEVDLSVEVNIFANKVAIISSSRDMVGLIIEDKPIADTLRNFHQALWPLLPDYR